MRTKAGHYGGRRGSKAGAIWLHRTVSSLCRPSDLEASYASTSRILLCLADSLSDVGTFTFEGQGFPVEYVSKPVALALSNDSGRMG